MVPLALIPACVSLTPDVAVVLGTLGLCLGFVECNRPGRILPGALGLTLTLFALASLVRDGPRAWAVLLLLGAALTLLANVWRRLPWWSLIAATVGAIAGLRFLIRPEIPGVRSAVAVVCGGVLGSLSALLSRIAYRARRLKAVD